MAQMVVNECSLEAVSIYQVTVNQFLCDDNDQTGAPMKKILVGLLLRGRAFPLD